MQVTSCIVRCVFCSAWPNTGNPARASQQNLSLPKLSNGTCKLAHNYSTRRFLIPRESLQYCFGGAPLWFCHGYVIFLCLFDNARDACSAPTTNIRLTTPKPNRERQSITQHQQDPQCQPLSTVTGSTETTIGRTHQRPMMIPMTPTTWRVARTQTRMLPRPPREKQQLALTGTAKRRYGPHHNKSLEIGTAADNDHANAGQLWGMPVQTGMATRLAERSARKR